MNPFQRLKVGLSKTRLLLGQGLQVLRSSRSGESEELLDEIEELLIQADIGGESARAIRADLHSYLASHPGADWDSLMSVVRERMVGILASVPPVPVPATPVIHPLVILVVGVNGGGKTTTIAKLAHRYVQSGQRVLLGAADTFRAAAVEQLAAWAGRTGADLLAQRPGADPASVAYDAVTAARARGHDVVILDTAGRLHTKVNLMQELIKIRRVIGKAHSGAPHEVLLVVDATMGQNAIAQAREFHQALEVTGIVVAKLDGTARGGVVLPLSRDLGLPVRWLGVGEGMDDIEVFHPEEFVDALISPD
ncbi:MAG: signal recognition particle-docking protein FtsY [Candidatus Eisenbacteria bacterium]|jgi:fused signal recognition particle receptor|nr:signal recognition particle-docking protein FtsY [Candidatus Eisenbacteria bacterium]